jgi:hypothetical protein
MEEVIKNTELELQASLARKAELLEAIEQVNKQIENSRVVLQVLRFAQQSTEAVPAEQPKAE